MPSNSHLALHVDAHIRPRVGGGLERVQLVLAGLGPEHVAHALPGLNIPRFAIKRTDNPASSRPLAAI